MIKLEDGKTLDMELITLHSTGEYDKGNAAEKRRIKAILVSMYFLEYKFRLFALES